MTISTITPPAPGAKMSQAQQKYLFDQLARAERLHQRTFYQVVDRRLPVPKILARLSRMANAHAAKHRKAKARLDRQLERAYRVAHEAALFKPTAEALKALRKFEAVRFK